MNRVCTNGSVAHSPSQQWLTSSAKRSCKTRWSARNRRTRPSGNGTPTIWADFQASLKISPAEFDEVAGELGRTLDFFKVPEREKEEVLAAFAAHKGEVTEGYSQ